MIEIEQVLTYRTFKLVQTFAVETVDIAVVAENFETAEIVLVVAYTCCFA